MSRLGDDEEENCFDGIACTDQRESADKLPMARGMAGRVYSLITNQGPVIGSANGSPRPWLPSSMRTVFAQSTRRRRTSGRNLDCHQPLAGIYDVQFDKDPADDPAAPRDSGENLTGYDAGAGDGHVWCHQGDERAPFGTGLRDLDRSLRRLGLESDPVTLAGCGWPYWV